MGVYVGAGGRAHPRAAALPDDALGARSPHVRLHKATHRLGRWEIEGGMTVLIERRDGSMVNTELWAQGVDFHSRPQVFRAVYHELRDRHLAAVAGLRPPDIVDRWTVRTAPPAEAPSLRASDRVIKRAPGSSLSASPGRGAAATCLPWLIARGFPVAVHGARC